MKKEICYDEFRKISNVLDNHLAVIARFDCTPPDGFYQGIAFSILMLLCENRKIDLPTKKIISVVEYTSEKFEFYKETANPNFPGEGSYFLVDFLRQIGYSITDPLEKNESCIIY